MNVNDKISSFIFILIITGVYGYSCDDSTRLHNKLLQNYNRRVRGIYNSSQKTDVHLETYLSSLLNYDEIHGIFTFVAFFDMIWKDERLKWNRTDYNGVDRIRLFQSEVWHPIMLPLSSARTMKSMGDDWMYVTISSEGKAYWISTDVFASTCHPNVTEYPFDIQECDVEFMFIGEGNEEINLVNEHVHLDLYRRHSRWNLLKTQTYINTFLRTNIKFHLVFTIQRENEFYVVGLILPISTLGLLNLLVFFIPPESGERISYSITVLLAMTVFLTIASDKLPPTSNPGFPLLCIKLFIDMTISTLLVVFTVGTLRMYHRDVEKCPIPPSYLFLCRMSRSWRYKKKPDIINEEENAESSSCAAQNDDTITWKAVTRRFDILFFSISLFLFLFSNSIIFYIACM